VTEKTADRPESTGWLVLIYRVPPEPTRLRSTVWRRIKEIVDRCEDFLHQVQEEYADLPYRLQRLLVYAINRCLGVSI